MLKKILFILFYSSSLLILLGFVFIIYSHFQRAEEINRLKLNEIAASLKKQVAAINSIQAALNFQSGVQLRAQGVFMSGECVPAPTCPDPKHFHPEIYVIPVSTIFSFKTSDKTPRFSPNFSATAVGAFQENASSPSDPKHISDCAGISVQPCKNRDGTEIGETNQKYWRVCLFLAKTEDQTHHKKTKKETNKTNGDAYSLGGLAVFTQCTPITPPEDKWNIEQLPGIH